jgi:hypothetical protein
MHTIFCRFFIQWHFQELSFKTTITLSYAMSYSEFQCGICLCLHVIAAFNPALKIDICLVWFGLVWFGLVWFGLVWFGLVWFGLVCVKGRQL